MEVGGIVFPAIGPQGLSDPAEARHGGWGPSFSSLAPQGLSSQSEASCGRACCSFASLALQCQSDPVKAIHGKQEHFPQPGFPSSVWPCTGQVKKRGLQLPQFHSQGHDWP